VSDAASIEERVNTLAAQVAVFAQENAQLAEERDEYRKLVLHLKEENERLKRGLLGQKAERVPRNDAQLSLAVLGLAMAGTGDALAAQAAEIAVEEQLIAQHTRQKPTRKPLPSDIPRVAIEILPPEVEREPDAFERIGVETREVLERRPAATVIVALSYPKFVRKDRGRRGPAQILVGETVELPIPRGVAGPSFLADTIVRRWQDHQPLNRLEGIYAREGLGLARSTICGWHAELGELARPLVMEAMFEDALGSPYVCVDATGVLVQAKDRCRNGHFWVLVAPERHVLFQYSQRHDSAAVDKLLPDYKGYLVADAHNVYDHLYKKSVVEVGCWAHCRRYFFKAMESDPERARIALSHIGTLFRIERLAVGIPRKKLRQRRLDQSKPTVDAFFAWCEVEADRVLDESPIADGIRYACNQREALQRFLDDPQLPLHNNISELNLRREVIGRRNWLFVGSDDGAEVNTIFVSLLASCRMHEIEPLSYIRDLLCLLPRWPRKELLELAPVNWRATCQRGDVQAALAANVFRRVVLEPRT
jgi:transposase